MTTEVSKLKAELNLIKMRESEAQEQINELNNQLSAEKKARLSAEAKLPVSFQNISYK